MEKLILPPEITDLLGQFDRAGYEARCVGGCVRDSLLGRTPADWDVTTNARPEEMKRIFSAQRTLDTGIAHGTVTVLYEDTPIEVTTYRSDGDYLDHRHPQGVQFAARLEDDLSRRDFTINAMAYHPLHGLCDLFDGRRDLQLRQLRCVGEPNRRFEEDALRILRCLRFASTLSFSIEDATAAALNEKQALLKFVSTERIREELYRLLCGAGHASILAEYDAILHPLLPLLLPMSHKRALTLLHALGADAFDSLLRQMEQQVPARQKEVSRLLQLIEKETKLQVSDLAVSGKDLLALGFAPGRELGECLNDLLSEVRAGRLENEREKLVERVRLLWEKNRE